ncbi:FAD-dependent oxidoreductase [Thioalkalivibrio sp. HK1]|uniref:FAD-dependent oxidoreductase n=1 Tax=Thioalkalivibrio sp. HK1 TaxID=1469245 RepID=UPI00047124FA|nr:FAD-dependent oxidoreductase [Thioalkalivibrio sp. HK1]
MAKERKIGAYICRGCGIGQALDADRLEEVAAREGRANLVRQHDFLCAPEGVETIRADLASGEVSDVVVCACSGRAMTSTFRFDGVAVARANLREGVVWSRARKGESSALADAGSSDSSERGEIPAKTGETTGEAEVSSSERETMQEMADDHIRMACTEIRFMTPPSPSLEQTLNRTILVVGGGISGMTAALESARAGYSVTIVEKSATLGGFAARLWKRIPDRSPCEAPVDPGIATLVSEVSVHERITVETSSKISRTSGSPGKFKVTIERCDPASGDDGSTGSRTETFGAIIQATGFTPFDPSHIPELGYAASGDVVTSSELEALALAAKGEALVRPSDAKPIKSVLFVQCAGQRSSKPGHLSYCSGYCCAASIKQAMYFQDADPSIETVVLYSDMRTPGSGGEDFYRSGQSRGIVFTKGETSAISAAGEGGGARVRYRDLILDEEVERDFDLVVLATGMVANAGVDSEANDTKTDEPDTNASAPAAIEIPVESILNLTYRQGPDLPHLAHGFADSHFICFPYETRRTGIYAAGPVRRPMDIAQAREDATGSAMKAIQAIENAGRGRAAHPRSGDLSFPKVRYDGCTQCKRCTVECPFGAIDEDEKRYPLFNESRCRRCGTCMGACPVRVISFENYSIDTVGQQIKSVEIPDETENKPRILVLACENDAWPALDMAARLRRSWSVFARVIPIRCLGSVNTIWVTDALNAGYDGVMLMGCKSGENYQCHFVKGSEMAQYRMTKIDDTLEQLGLEKERVITHEVAITDIERAPRLINEMERTIARIGPSPLKF